MSKPGSIEEAYVLDSLLVADILGDVHFVNAFDSASQGLWVSQTLNREDATALVSIIEVLVRYAAVDASAVTVGLSGDGGVTWEERTVSLPATTEKRVGWALASFGSGVTGPDMRLRLKLVENEDFVILGLIPRAVERGKVHYGRAG